MFFPSWLYDRLHILIFLVLCTLYALTSKKCVVISASCALLNTICSNKSAKCFVFLSGSGTWLFWIQQAYWEKLTQGESNNPLLPACSKTFLTHFKTSLPVLWQLWKKIVTQEASYGVSPGQVRNSLQSVYMTKLPHSNCVHERCNLSVMLYAWKS